MGRRTLDLVLSPTVASAATHQDQADKTNFNNSGTDTHSIFLTSEKELNDNKDYKNKSEHVKLVRTAVLHDAPSANEAAQKRKQCKNKNSNVHYCTAARRMAELR